VVCGNLGVAAATVGDVNGDGFGDIIVGAPGAGTGESGRAYLYLGGPAGTDETPTLVASTRLDMPGGTAGAHFGATLSAAGDVAGDGYADVIVAAPDAPASGPRVFLFRGSRTGLETTAAASLTAAAGVAVASVGDVNGDGFGDIVVSSSGARQARIFLGAAAGLGQQPAATLTAPPASDEYGAAVDGAGDVDGDGYDDVIVGAPAADSGRAYVYFGGAAGVDTANGLVFVGPGQVGGRFGHAVAGAGDIDHDGYGDVVVGAPFDTINGATYGFLGRPMRAQIPAQTPIAAATSRTTSVINNAGSSVAGQLDVQLDGLADVLAGAPLSNGSLGGFVVWMGLDYAPMTSYIPFYGTNGPASGFGTVVAELDRGPRRSRSPRTCIPTRIPVLPTTPRPLWSGALERRREPRPS
jgi:hypothetical protein